MAIPSRNALRCERYGDDEAAVLDERYRGAFQWGRPAEAMPVDEATAALQRAELAAALATFDAYPTKTGRPEDAAGITPASTGPQTAPATEPAVQFLHIVSNWQHWLGRFADVTGLDSTAPRALCGFSLVVTDDDELHDLDPDAVICPQCLALNSPGTGSEAAAAAELDHPAVR